MPENHQQWIVPFAVQIIPSGLLFLGTLWLRESPRWLFKNGYNKEALQVLCDVYGREPDHPKIIKEQKEVLDAIKAEDERGQYKWSQILKRDEVQTGRRVLLAWGMQLMNQLGGINLIV